MRKSDVLAALTADERFFFNHAGFSYDPATETVDQGRARGAIAMAAAEVLYLEAHRVADVSCEWDNDSDGDEGWETSCEVAWIGHRQESGGVGILSSLSGIWDADADYRRVIRAELAQEAQAALVSIIAESRNVTA